MKNCLAFAFAVMVVFALTACGDSTNEESNSSDNEAVGDSANEQEETNGQEEPSEKEENESSDGSKEEDEMYSAEERITVAFDDEEIIIKMYDNPTSRAFLNQLPLTMTFEEFGGFEKLSYPPEKLTTEEAPSGHVPARGDFAYYSPWGNVNMYYGDHTYSAGLVKLGEIESGVKLLDSIQEDFTVSIRKID